MTMPEVGCRNVIATQMARMVFFCPRLCPALNRSSQVSPNYLPVQKFKKQSNAAKKQ